MGYRSSRGGSAEHRVGWLEGVECKPKGRGVRAVGWAGEGMARCKFNDAGLEHSCPDWCQVPRLPLRPDVKQLYHAHQRMYPECGLQSKGSARRKTQVPVSWGKGSNQQRSHTDAYEWPSF